MPRGDNSRSRGLDPRGAPPELREELQRLRAEVEALRLEREDLEARLEEARTTLNAIRNGEVDAFVVSPPRTAEHISTLQEVEFPYRKLVETMNEGALTLLEDGTILFCNGRFADMLGVPRERLIEAQIRSLVPPAGRPGLDAVLRSGVAGNARGETRFLGAMGSVVPAHLSVSPLEIGDWRCLCVVATDLTDQKKTEEILAAEKLARLILDQAAEAIVVTNESGRVLRANESAVEICGGNPLLRDFRAAYPVRLTMRGVQVIDGMRPSKGEPAFPLVPDLRGRSFRGVETELMSGQERRFFLLSAGPLLARGDKLLGFVATLTDITERKKAEESLLRTNADLEASVERRTQELRATNETLRQEIAERQDAEEELALRVDELRRSNTELERFAYVSSHDLQEPLRTITSFTQLLARRLEGSMDPEAKQYVDYVVDGARRMHDLLQDLLIFLRLRTEGLGVREAATQECLRVAMKNLGKAIEESGASIVAGELPTVRADPRRLVQVFQNLVGNAIKYRGQEPPVVEVSARRIGANWEFSVKDNGIGIDHLYHERVFEIFQRLHTREEYSGTGIGLAICKQIVEQHGGRIWVESEPGRGSIFRFSLPEGVPVEATAG